MAWLTPKVNWTANDYYDHTALNRVENNTYEVALYMQYYADVALLLTLGYNTTRTMQTIEFADGFNWAETLQNYISTRITPPAGWQRNKANWKPGDKFSFTDANRIENNLKLLYDHYKGNSDLIPRCGVARSGEAIV